MTDIASVRILMPMGHGFNPRHISDENVADILKAFDHQINVMEKILTLENPTNRGALDIYTSKSLVLQTS